MANNNILTELPVLQYSGIDFNTVTQEMVRIITDNPKWSENWTSFYSGEAGTLLTEFMAFIADNLAIKIDSMINEFFISTATRNIDKIRLLKLINYVPKYANASKLYITLETESLINEYIILTPAKDSYATLRSRVNNINYTNARDSFGQISRFEFLPYIDGNTKPDYLSAMLLPNTNNSISYESYLDSTNKLTDLYLTQGTTKYIEFTSETSDGPTFDIIDTNIAADSIRIYRLDIMNEHNEVKSFIQNEAFNESYGIPYVVSLNENGTTRIEYASKEVLTNENRRFPVGQTIGVFYRTCSGTRGNIPIGFLNTNVTLSTQSGRIIRATISNNSIGVGGTDAEELNKAVINGPLSLRTMERAVTPEDFDIIINAYGSNSIIQSKNYTSTNMPENFKNIYGRYINPQEIFSILITNKGISIPPSQYNNYPWLFLKHHNMFNEQYLFDIAKYNQLITTTPIIPELLVTKMNSTTGPQLFRNCIILNIGNEFNNNIITGTDSSNGLPIPNTTIKLKLHKEVIYNQKYFLDIPFSFIFDDNIDLEIQKQTVLQTIPGDIPSYQNIIISQETNAKFLSDRSWQVTNRAVIHNKDDNNNIIEEWHNTSEPINILNYKYINLILDNKATIQIDLKPIENDGGWAENYPNSPYYIYLSHTPYGTEDTKPDITEKWSNGTTLDANKRYGIIELINQQIFNLIDEGINNSDPYNMYGPNKSYQYLNISKTSFLDPITNLLTSFPGEDINTEKAYLTVSINDEIYRFIISESVFENARDYFYNYTIDGVTYPERNRVEKFYNNDTIDPAIFKYSISGVAIQLDYQLINPSSSNHYLEKYNGSSWTKVLEVVDGIRCDCQLVTQFSTDNGYINSGNGTNISFGINDVNTNLNYLNYDIIFYSYNEDGLYNNSFIKIENDETQTIDNEKSLLRTLKGLDNMAQIWMPEPQYAADYNNLASVVETDTVSAYGTIITTQHLQIKSPLTGESSSIYFMKDTENTYDFLEQESVLKYNNSYVRNVVNGQTSDKAYGIKRITLFYENAINTTYGNGDIYNINIQQGNVIYEHNCININTDLPNVYASYKINSNNELELGTVYNNFYYTGNVATDIEYKPEVIGINGQYVEEVSLTDNKIKYVINEDKSNFEIKFTNEPVETSSIYAITSNIDVIPVDIIQLNTIDLLTIASETSTFIGAANLIFSIDDMEAESLEPFFIDLHNCRSSNDVYNVIIAFFNSKIEDTKYTKYVSNRNSIIKKSFNSRNSLIFSNLSKRESGNITFYFDETPGVNNIQLYVNLFGTSLTNPDFYNLYSSDIFNSSNIQDYLGGIVYVPTKDNPLIFNYRTIVEEYSENGLISRKSRTGDYYIELIDKIGRNGNIMQGFKLVKTSNSTFQDFPFYIHFVNNREFETNKDGNLITNLDEDLLQEYMRRYKISGMDITFLQPYFRTFDVRADVEYSRNFSFTEIDSAIRNTLSLNYSLQNMNIGRRLSRSKIFKDIMNINGVLSCKITYFGFDVTNVEQNLEELPCDFYEILCLRENTYDTFGNQITGIIINLLVSDE